jgi:Tfp pilus assembly protein PilO
MMIIVNRLWLLLILYTGYDVYEKYNEHTEKLKDIQGQKAAVENTVRRNQKKVDQLSEVLENIKAAEKRMKKVEAQAIVIQKKFPSIINDAELMNLFNNIANNINIKNIQINTVGEQNNGFYFIKTYQFKASATYLQTLLFLEKVSENEKLLNVKDIVLKTLDIKQRSRHQLLDTTITIMAYRYNSNFKIDLKNKKKSKQKVKK